MRLLFSYVRKISKSLFIQKVSLVLVTILVLTFLFVKTQAVNPAQHNRYNRDLLRLKEVDVILNQDVLKVRQGLLLHYDPLVADLNRLKQLLNNLEKIPASVDGSRQAETKQQLKAYANVLQKKKILIESFKTQYATLKNSLSYFPIVTTQVAEKASSTAANQTLANNLNIFLRDVLIYNLSSSEELAPKIKAQIESLLKS